MKRKRRSRSAWAYEQRFPPKMPHPERTDPRQQHLWPARVVARGQRTWWPRAPAEGDVLVRYSGFSIEMHDLRREDDYNPSFKLHAVDNAGRSIGELYAERNEPEDAMAVRGVYADRGGHPTRKGLGTRLYENAHRVACAVFGLPLASDEADRRSLYSEAFWRKQVRKRRAFCDGSATEIDDEGDEVDTGECAYYVLPCPAGPLTGARSRGKRARR